MCDTSVDQSQSGWQDVNPRKKKRNSPVTQRNVRQKTLGDYWLNPTHTENRFENLPVDSNNDDEPVSVEPKPPPLFIYGVLDMRPLTTLLETHAKDAYQSKLIGGSQVKLQIKDVETYQKIVKLLQEKKTEFHTYQQKADKNYKVVIKDLHHTTDIEDLKTEINKLGHKVTRITNIKHRVSKNPLPLFFVEIEQGPNNKSIYDVMFLCHSRVKIEPPRFKREVPQCVNCQRYGHTRSYCHRRARCVKCAGDHLTTLCAWKDKENENVKCVLCGQNHPANYKGCSVYQEILQRKFPPLRPKFVKEAPTTLPTSSIRTGTSFAQATSNKTGETQQTSYAHQKTEQTPSQSSDITELKSMMKGLMEQMGIMLNLLTTIVTRMPQCSTS